MMRKKWMVIGLALGLSVPVAFVAHPASAATSDAIAQALVTATLQNLGLSNISPELSQQLSGQLTDAIDAGVIDPTISAQIASLLENPALISGLSDVFNAHLDGETSAWKTSVLAPDNTSGIVGGDDATNTDDSQDSANSDDGSGDQGLDNSGYDGNSGSDGESEDWGSSGGQDANNPGRDGSSGNGGNGGNGSDEEDGEDGGDYQDDSIDG
jgi:hypothetical protein